jgi:hypothetical protein
MRIMILLERTEKPNPNSKFKSFISNKREKEEVHKIIKNRLERLIKLVSLQNL